jgi:hypothetical protein
MFGCDDELNQLLFALAQVDEADKTEGIRRALSTPMRPARREDIDA